MHVTSNFDRFSGIGPAEAAPIRPPVPADH